MNAGPNKRLVLTRSVAQHSRYVSSIVEQGQIGEA